MNERLDVDFDGELEEQERADKIRLLNDHFRQTFTGGNLFITPGIQALPDPIPKEALIAVQQFDNFSPDNDPYGHHDFGEVEIQGVRIWFKIDCYDLNLQYGSTDATDPNVTTRVMTIFLPEEY